MHIYIGFETLKVKCTQYGICSQVAFKNARAMFFSFSGGAGSCFRAGLKKTRAGAEISCDGGPRPDLTPPIVRRGVLSVRPLRPSLDAYMLMGSTKSMTLCG